MVKINRLEIKFKVMVKDQSSMSRPGDSTSGEDQRPGGSFQPFSPPVISILCLLGLTLSARFVNDVFKSPGEETYCYFRCFLGLRTLSHLLLIDLLLVFHLLVFSETYIDNYYF